MYIKTLRIENFRNLKQVEIEPHPSLNFFYGPNGAGKTSLLEALVVLARGRSFKTSQAEELSGEASGAFRIVVETDRDGRTHRLGLERSGAHWKARKDGEDVSVLSAMTRQLPMVLMEPNSHLLISGTPDGRRRFLDWGVFHVEPEFLNTWRRYARTLKQRNAALRSQQLRVLDSLDELTVQLGQQLNEYRKAYFACLAAEFAAQADQSSQEFRAVTVEYHTGWKGESLHEALLASRKRDLEQGVTSQGPHRADLVLTKENKPIRTLLSRGEQKSFAATLLLTQARLLATEHHAPLVLLDDLASEFDQDHVRAVLESALACAGQVWVTGTERPKSSELHTVFHVKHGEVQELV